MKNISLIALFTLLFTSCASRKPLNQKKASIYYGHGTQKLIEKNYTEALTFLLQASELDPENTDILTNLGMAYYFKKELGLAKKHFNEALEADPKNSDARNNLASIYLEQKNYAEAKRHYNIIKKDLTYPKQFRTNYNLALIELHEEKKQVAIDLLKLASKEKQDYCAANTLLGKTYYETRHYKDALEWFKKATMGKCFSEPLPHYFIGKTFVEMRRYDEAIQKFVELQERFAQSRYSSLSSLELKKIRSLRENESIEKKNWSKWREEKDLKNYRSPSF